uniref:Uncharacterized protein n=1 Tax=Fagus sylvatica TaxID=28930 RepID=A0A2N9HSP7_FAGSY
MQEEERKKVELERRQKEEMEAKRKAEDEIRKKKEEEEEQRRIHKEKEKEERKVQQEKEEELIRKAQEEKEQEEERNRKRDEENLVNQEFRPEVENDEITPSTSIPKVEEVILDQLEADNDTPTLPEPDIEIIEPTMEAVEQSSAIILATIIHICTTIENEKEIQTIQQGCDEKKATKSEFQQEFEQTLKKYEETKQEISRIKKELQKL